MGSPMKIKNYGHFQFYMLLQWENGKMAIFDTKNILPEKKTTVNFHFIFTQNIVLLSYYIFMKKKI